MCYRFQQTWPTQFDDLPDTGFDDLLGKLFGIEEPPPFSSASNIAPTDSAVVVTNAIPRKAEYFRFFLIPSFAKDRKYYDLTLGNARDDKVASSKLFAQSFRTRRCIVPVSGYYEFKKTGDKKTDPKIPYVFYVKDQPMFGLAGIWDSWTDPANRETLNCFAIITTSPNELAAPIHNRMPVILPTDSYQHWLDSDEQNLDMLQSLLRPYPSKELIRREFSNKLNNSRNKDESTIVPIGPAEGID